MPEILLILFMLGWSSRHRDLVLRRGFAWDTAQGLGGGHAGSRTPGSRQYLDEPPHPTALALAVLPRELIFKISIRGLLCSKNPSGRRSTDFVWNRLS